MKEEPNGPLAVFDVSPGDGLKFSDCVCKILVEKKIISKKDDCSVKKFKDKETDIEIDESVRGKDIYVFQNYIDPLGERLHELYYFLDAVKTGGCANRVNVVFPFLLGSRGERRTRARQPVPTLVIARNLKANGVDNVLTVCVHTPSVCTVYNAVGSDGIHFENLEFEYIVANYLINNAKDNSVVASPDAGGIKRVYDIKKLIHEKKDIDLGVAFTAKYRTKPNASEIIECVGDVKDKTVYLIDDIADTLKTIVDSKNEFKKKGAGEIYVLACHPVLSSGTKREPGCEKRLDDLLEDDLVKGIYFGNTIPFRYPLISDRPKLKFLALEPFVAEAIRRHHFNLSMSEMHDYDKIVEAYKSINFEYPYQTIKIEK